jgi:hypothetical protein
MYPFDDFTPHADSPSKGTWLRRICTLLVFLALAATACGSGEGGNTEVTVPASPAADHQPVIREEPLEPGDDPFTVSLVRSSAGPDTTEDAAATGPGLYGGTGENTCDRDLLVASLAAQPARAGAWADAAGVDLAAIETYIGDLRPVVLVEDTRVTNHGYRDGRARPFQSLLAAGTAVLVDADGTPRTRCACGNPLAEPDQAAGPPPSVTSAPEGHEGDGPDSSETPQDDGAMSFCAVWTTVAPSVTGGPDAPGPEALARYLTNLAGGLDLLVSAAETTAGFPEDALDDLVAYQQAVQDAADSGTPGAADPALRDRVETFLSGYCSEPPTTTAPEEPSEDPGSESGDAPSGGTCGSMQFFLLIVAADGVGLGHESVSASYLDALDAILAGADPGAGFDVGDLAPMLAYEDVGCQGAAAMQQLFAEAGLGHLIEGTELDG